MPKVLIVQRRLTHYRVPLYSCLRDKLGNLGVDLTLACGEPTRQELSKKDGAELDWSISLPTKYFFGNRVCWIPYRHLMSKSDLTIVPAENKLVFNLFSQYLNRSGRLALWGHGANLQGSARSLREKFKRVTSKKADWWFAYTEMSASLVQDFGFPSERITVLNNSVDTQDMKMQYDSVTADRRQQLALELDLIGKKVGVYVGSLYDDKRIPFLLEAVSRIKAVMPLFHLLIVGDGPDRRFVEDFSRRNSWVRYLGVRKGREKAEILSLSHVMLNPGLVGLGILDSFVCGVPMVTTDCGLHSPEISYLNNDFNGVMVNNSVDDFAAAVVNVLSSSSFRGSLRRGCLQSAEKYTVENMAENFSIGIVKCLSMPGYR